MRRTSSCGKPRPLLVMPVRVAVLTLLALSAFSARSQESVSPFSAVRWTDSPSPEVRLGGTWHSLVFIEDVSADSLAQKAIREAGREWQEYISEDISDLLQAAEWTHGTAVRLRIASGGTVRDTLVMPTPEARWQSRWYALVGQWADAGVRRPASVSAADAARSPFTVRFDTSPGEEAWAAANPYDVTSDPAGHMGFEMSATAEGAWIRAEEAEADLAALEAFLAANYSYYAPRADRFLAAVDTIRAGLGESISRRDFAFQVRHAVAQFGDGHTRLSLSRNELRIRGKRLPFTLREAEGRVVAAALFGGFEEADYPFLTHLDGEPVEDWLRAAHALNPATAPHRARQTALSTLYAFEHLRTLRRKASGDSVTVRLERADGASAVERTLPLVHPLPTPGPSTDPSWRQRPDGVGVLMLPRMNRGRSFRAQLRAAMDALRETDGLIIDVRGNGGGARDALTTLLPYLIDAPRVVNAARLRIDAAIDPHPSGGYLSERSMKPLASGKWSAAERSAIDAWWSTFEPQFDAPDSLFSAWHAMVVSPEAAPFRYRAPVVVLMDSDTFSATDIFLGAMKGVPGVTLVGTASGGGSGFARDVYLPHSRLSVSASSMASYLPGGDLYETSGVAPDIEHVLTLDELGAVLRGDDPQMEAAAALLSSPDR